MVTKERQYIGARYVIKVYENSQVAGSAEWEEDTVYEPLVLVTYQNGSYLSKKYVPSTVGNPAANTDYWVQTGFYNGQIANLQHQIDTINETLSDLGDDFDELENSITARVNDLEKDIFDIAKNSKSLTGNLILNYNYDFATKNQCQGGCYIGNNRYLVYFYNPSSSIGTLRCFNTGTYTIEWEHNINAYHGGTITYNPNTNKIYICAGLTPENVPMNLIAEIDLTSPSTIVRTITLPEVTSCMSLIYDSETDLFYSMPYSGTTAGTSDMLYVFNNELTEVVRTVQLKDFPSVKYGISHQGINVVLDGIGYLATSNAKLRAIYGYDINTGDIVSISDIPPIINKCRAIGEVEHLMYNYDTEQMLVGSVLFYSGVDGYHAYSLFEVDMFKGIAVINPDPGASLFGLEMDGRAFEFTCVKAATGLKPSWWYNKAWLSVPNDGFIYSSYNNCGVLIAFAKTGANIGSEQGEQLSALQTSNANVIVEGYGANDRLKVRGIGCETACNIILRRCEIAGYEVTRLSSGYYANVFAKQLANILLQDCTLASYTGDGSHDYHLISYLCAKITTLNCTFEGTVTSNSLTALGGEVDIIS